MVVTRGRGAGEHRESLTPSKDLLSLYFLFCYPQIFTFFPSLFLFLSLKKHIHFLLSVRKKKRTSIPNHLLTISFFFLLFIVRLIQTTLTLFPVSLLIL